MASLFLPVLQSRTCKNSIYLFSYAHLCAKFVYSDVATQQSLTPICVRVCIFISGQDMAN